MADFSVPNYGDLINNLNTQIAAGPPKVDFSEIGKLPNSYWEGLDQKAKIDQRDAFKNGIPNDPKELVDKLAKVQGTAAAPQIMQYYKMLFGQQADQEVNGTGNVPSAAPSVARAQPVAQPATQSAPPPGGPVPSSARVVGDDEGVRAGLYDPPATPGARPPVQQDAQTPNQRVAGGFPSSGALVAPDLADPTLGGLVPNGRTPAQQRGLLSSKIASGMLDEAQTKNYQARIDAIDKALGQYREGNVKNSEMTPAQKDANASGVSGGPLALDTLKEQYKQDADAFQKRYTGIQSAGEHAAVGMQKAQLLKNATLDPNFYSGPLNDYVKTYRQFQSIFGTDPGKAAPAELFTKVANDMLQEQIKSMGQSGVGRVLQAEVGIMKQALASMGNTPLSNRALAEIVSRTYQHSQEIADLTRNMPRKPGQMTQSLDQATQDYLKSKPLFSQDELQHPQILGAPDAPPQSAQWSPQQKQQWARSIGLKSGDPIRFNGQVVSVP